MPPSLQVAGALIIMALLIYLLTFAIDPKNNVSMLYPKE